MDLWRSGCWTWPSASSGFARNRTSRDVLGRARSTEVKTENRIRDWKLRPKSAAAEPGASLRRGPPPRGAPRRTISGKRRGSSFWALAGASPRARLWRAASSAAAGASYGGVRCRRRSGRRPRGGAGPSQRCTSVGCPWGAGMRFDQILGGSSERAVAPCGARLGRSVMRATFSWFPSITKGSGARRAWARPCRAHALSRRAMPRDLRASFERKGISVSRGASEGARSGDRKRASWFAISLAEPCPRPGPAPIRTQAPDRRRAPALAGSQARAIARLPVPGWKSPEPPATGWLVAPIGRSASHISRRSPGCPTGRRVDRRTGSAQIEGLRRVAVAALAQHDVVGAQITMNDVGGVGGLEPCGPAASPGGHLQPAWRPVARRCRQESPREQLGDEVGEPPSVTPTS